MRKLWINNQLVDGSGGTRSVIDPATEEAFGEVAWGETSDAERAIRACYFHMGKFIFTYAYCYYHRSGKSYRDNYGCKGCKNLFRDYTSIIKRLLPIHPILRLNFYMKLPI